MEILTVIPARMASTRLPGKPLADIHGKPMIVHVWERAKEANLGEVIVACAEQEIADAIVKAGGQAVMTDPDLPSGSDRIYQAVERFDVRQKPDVILNLQGDLPTIAPSVLQAMVTPLTQSEVDIVTAVAPIHSEGERTNPNVVKAIWASDGESAHGKALYFTRATAPANDGPLWHHIGLYAYRWDALKKFVSLSPSPLEKREKLEQLRALEAGMHIEVVQTDDVPLGVDTPEDLEKARALLPA
jgi:3-deoxy-manno-octulosonate cytidylyltransferase (CMP-KDO synthetase)